MRTRILIAATSVIIFAIGGCSTPPKPQISEISLPTVQCEMCTSQIEEALEGLEGVESVTVKLDLRKASVEFVPEKIALAKIEQTIAGIGYDANSQKRDQAAYEQLPECCQ